ncbi:hypothetical protein [Paraburkholderia caribensis]|uniref:hypothetical protein n=1 Tax=Paraburkholderia caribensis TaxID=75105 RepID=UPI00078BA6FD|nr:hypothetical protein [Paraburkholderia caribensis]AMV47784.1 hypothetical protein ATN79_44770 [Paraburkholderia caribensis]
MSYLHNTEYAVRHLIELAVREDDMLLEAQRQLAGAEAQLKFHEWDFRTSDQSEDFSDAHVMAAFGRMARAAQSIPALKADVAGLQSRVTAHKIAVQSICGAILQIAKQGISSVHGELAAAPEGRRIGTLVVRDIIWQGRNQALHYEDTKPLGKHVTQVFEALEAEQGGEFSLKANPAQSRALQVVQLLGWRGYDAYCADMQGLLV